MKKRTIMQSLTRRQEVGNTILHLADGLDTSKITDRLDAFRAAHQAYLTWLAHVDDVQQRFDLAQRRITEAGQHLNAKLEATLVALIVDGHPRSNPFSSFGAPSPSRLAELKPSERQRVALHLTATMRRDPNLSPATLATLEGVDTAASELADAVPVLTSMIAEDKAARLERDKQAAQWDAALQALKYSARLAAYDGSDTLYVALFGGPAKSKRTATAEEPQTTSVSEPHDTPKAA